MQYSYLLGRHWRAFCIHHLSIGGQLWERKLSAEAGRGERATHLSLRKLPPLLLVALLCLRGGASTITGQLMGEWLSRVSPLQSFGTLAV